MAEQKKMQDPYATERAHLQAVHPMLRYDGEETVPAWQERARGVLGELLGFSAMRRVTEEAFTIDYDREQEGHREIRFSLQTEEGYAVPAVLCIPKDIPLPVPVCLCLQGHSTGMHISLGRPKWPGDEKTIANGDWDFARRILAEGVAALCVEQRCMGECGSKADGYPDCQNTAMTALLTGRTLLGERVWDIMRVVDHLYRFPELDTERVWCMGNSGGGTATLYAAAMDPRLTAAMPSCAVCDFAASIGAMYHCACNYVPRIANYFDMGDIAALIAPRPLVVVCGVQDSIFPLPGVKHAVAVAQDVYRAAGAQDRLRLVQGEGGHRFYAKAAWNTFNALVR